MPCSVRSSLLIVTSLTCAEAGAMWGLNNAKSNVLFDGFQVPPFGPCLSGAGAATHPVTMPIDAFDSHTHDGDDANFFDCDLTADLDLLRAPNFRHLTTQSAGAS